MFQDDILTLSLRRYQLRTLSDTLEELLNDNTSRFSLDKWRREELEVVLGSVQLLLFGYSRYSSLNF